MAGAATIAAIPGDSSRCKKRSAAAAAAEYTVQNQAMAAATLSAPWINFAEDSSRTLAPCPSQNSSSAILIRSSSGIGEDLLTEPVPTCVEVAACQVDDIVGASSVVP